MTENKIFENISKEDAAKIAAMIADEAQNQTDEFANKALTCENCADKVPIEEKKDDVYADEAVSEESKVQTNINQKAASNGEGFGKFKNPQELLKAYGELEKEFTRRSQRLKELESGKQPLKSEEDWKGAVDKFFSEIPAAKAFAKDIASEIIRNPELREDANCLNVALVRVLTDKFRTPEQLMQDGQFLNDYVLSSERVRDAIIADYLEGVRADLPPHTLKSGGLQCVAPKVKPRTIEEAGFMFLKNNK